MHGQCSVSDAPRSDFVAPAHHASAFERVELDTRRQSFRIARHLDGETADAVAARDGFPHRPPFKQRA